MGSSLKVAPVANVMDRIPSSVPQILINMESLSHMSRFDVHLIGYSDIVTQALSRALGWDDDLESSSGGVDSSLECVPGTLPWHWHFAGAIPPKVAVPEEGGVEDVKSDEESEDDESELSEDSNTPEPPEINE